jgi:hypothetical protein
MRAHVIIPLCLVLAACGAETAGTAAVAGKARQEEARQARETVDDYQRRLEEVQALRERQLREQEQAAQQ